jgi:hypothetical protein
MKNIKHVLNNNNKNDIKNMLKFSVMLHLISEKFGLNSSLPKQ